MPTLEQGLLGIFERHFRAQADRGKERETLKGGTEKVSKVGGNICLMQKTGDRWRWGTAGKAALQRESLLSTADKRGGAVTRGQETETHGNKVNLITYGVTQKNVRCCFDMLRSVNNSYVECSVMRFVELQNNLYAPTVTRTWELAAVSVEVLSFRSY